MNGQRWRNSLKSSSLEKVKLYTNGLDAKKTILPSSLQRNHHNAITQIRGQECLSTFKKRQYIRNWYEKMNGEQDLTLEADMWLLDILVWLMQFYCLRFNLWYLYALNYIVENSMIHVFNCVFEEVFSFALGLTYINRVLRYRHNWELGCQQALRFWEILMI